MLAADEAFLKEFTVFSGNRADFHLVEDQVGVLGSHCNWLYGFALCSLSSDELQDLVFKCLAHVPTLIILMLLI
jgi:hypothetical protein